MPRCDMDNNGLRIVIHTMQTTKAASRAEFATDIVATQEDSDAGNSA